MSFFIPELLPIHRRPAASSGKWETLNLPLRRAAHKAITALRLQHLRYAGAGQRFARKRWQGTQMATARRKKIGASNAPITIGNAGQSGARQPSGQSSLEAPRAIELYAGLASGVASLVQCRCLFRFPHPSRGRRCDGSRFVSYTYQHTDFFQSLDSHFETDRNPATGALSCCCTLEETGENRNLRINRPQLSQFGT